MATWSREFTIEFIDLLKAQRPLWDMKSEDYRNKVKREECLENMANKLRTFDPIATRDQAMRKIHNLRTVLVFIKEYKKMVESLSPDSSLSDYYIPKLWYFKNLMFLKHDADVSTSDESQDNSDNGVDEKPKSLATPSILNNEPSRKTFLPKINSSLPFQSVTITKSMKRKREPSEDIEEPDVEEKFELPPEIKEDQYDIFGKIVALKLRRLPKDQRLFAEKIINDTLFEAEMRNLNRSSCLIVHNVEEDPIFTSVESFLPETSFEEPCSNSSKRRGGGRRTKQENNNCAENVIHSIEIFPRKVDSEDEL